MSLAAPIDAMDAGDSARPDVLEQGVVVVRYYGLGHSMAACSCGWAGRRRYLKAAAQQDAWLHSMHENCATAFPLMIRLPAA